MALIRNQLLELLKNAIAPLLAEDQKADVLSSVDLEIPKVAQHGDYASNIALALARVLKRKPREIAEQIVANLEGPHAILDHTEIAGPGFINFFLKADAWKHILLEILAEPDSYGRQDLGKGKRVQVEFVSANPTGPLHIGHGRGAATGDVLAGILAACGYTVQREYYINDAGNQMDTLGRSLYYRYQQLLGSDIAFSRGPLPGRLHAGFGRRIPGISRGPIPASAARGSAGPLHPLCR